eukprot:gnl/TRDRNA2_/TRDRNA2_126164_c0_seq1.p1 gnl/TRDRNA2_/TRDRNA2_126164_c0~~gnl/TRDRNA2_/TRDRNA2_126164_c0_seq1.p1  ORF type:complete len:454 (+),score=32.54 gnl/TRDRNA2_/TRDRNA2_126164_c0_seq1:180-1541(+)
MHSSYADCRETATPSETLRWPSQSRWCRAGSGPSIAYLLFWMSTLAVLMSKCSRCVSGMLSKANSRMMDVRDQRLDTERTSGAQERNVEQMRKMNFFSGADLVPTVLGRPVHNRFPTHANYFLGIPPRRGILHFRMAQLPAYDVECRGLCRQNDWRPHQNQRLAGWRNAHQHRSSARPPMRPQEAESVLVGRCREHPQASAGSEAESFDRPGEALLALLDQGVVRCSDARSLSDDSCEQGPFAVAMGPLPSPAPGISAALAAGPVLDRQSRWRFPAFGRCILADDVFRLADRDLETFLASILRALPEAVATSGTGAAEVQLTRFDLFHGHLFARPGDRGLGILLHAAEYPARCKETFDIELGYCQRSSPLNYTASRMRWRNLLLLFPAFQPDQQRAEIRGFVLDGDSPEIQALIPEYARAPLYTLCEGTLGVPLADVYFLADEAVPLGWVPRR